jgi:hypothetical protein
MRLLRKPTGEVLAEIFEDEDMVNSLRFLTFSLRSASPVQRGRWASAALRLVPVTL